MAAVVGCVVTTVQVISQSDVTFLQLRNSDNARFHPKPSEIDRNNFPRISPQTAN